jgi:hypothetical protein
LLAGAPSHASRPARAPLHTPSATLASLLASDGKLRVRAPADALNPEAAAATGRWVSTWLPLRCLVRAGLAEHFVIHIDEAGRIYGLEFTPPGGACAPGEGPAPAAPARWAFRSTAAVKLPKDAPPLPSTPTQRFDPDAVDAAAEAAEGAQTRRRKHTARTRCAARLSLRRVSVVADARLRFRRTHTRNARLTHAASRAPPFLPPAGPGGGAAPDELAEKPPERSFLSKYGMVIAVLMFNLIFRGATGGATEEAPASGGAARGAAGAKCD